MTCPNPKCAQFVKDNKWIAEQYQKLEQEHKALKDENTLLYSELEFFKREYRNKEEEAFNARRQVHTLQCQIDKANEDVFGG